MNQNIRIKVKTPVGESDSVDTGPGVGQGTVDGATLSSVNLDNGVKEEFHDNDENVEQDEVRENVNKIDKVNYEGITLEPLLFQDDVLNILDSVEAAQLSNKKMENILENKLLDFNLQKSAYIIAGSKKARQKLKVKVEGNPIMLCSQLMKEVTSEKYLGCQLSATVADCVINTVNKRLGLATQHIYEIRAVLEDSRNRSVGSVTTAFQMWDASVLPMLLFGCETWSPVPKIILNKLKDLTTRFLKVTMGVGKNGCPLPCLYWMTGTKLIENEILQRKMMFYHHVSTLPPGTLSRDFHNVQKEHGLGVVAECQQVLEEWNLSNIEVYSKNQF